LGSNTGLCGEVLSIRSDRGGIVFNLGEIMKIKILSILAVFSFAFLASSVLADNVVASYNCKL
jgi:hypothetical protein